MSALEKIANEIADQFGYEIYDHETEDAIASYIYTKYPGDYIVTVNGSDRGIRVDFRFTTPQDHTMFCLRY